MAGQLALQPTSTWPPDWTLLFAREPEPDPDLDDIPTGPMDRGRSSIPPAPPPRRSSRGPLLLFLLLLVIAGGTYLYMEPETLRGLLPESVMDLLAEAPPPSAPMSPEQAPEGPPPLAAGPGSKQDSPQLSSPSTSPFPAAQGEQSPPAGPGAAVPTIPPPTAPPGEPGRPVTPPAPPTVAGTVPEPRFGEGQLVTVRRDPSTPDQVVPLTADAAGTKPGPMVRPGTAVRVLDGDLQGNVWVYSVKTPEGAKGWLAEDRLQPKP